MVQSRDQFRIWDAVFLNGNALAAQGGRLIDSREHFEFAGFDFRKKFQRRLILAQGSVRAWPAR